MWFASKLRRCELWRIALLDPWLRLSRGQSNFCMVALAE
jgi:hypothetical protein